MKCWFDFLSIWAICAHVLCLIGLLPSTLALSMAILGGSIYHKIFTPAPYILLYDILIHYVPVAVLFVFVKHEIVLWPIFLLYTMYFTWWGFDFAAMHRMYETNNAPCFEEEYAKNRV